MSLVITKCASVEQAKQGNLYVNPVHFENPLDIEIDGHNRCIIPADNIPIGQIAINAKDRKLFGYTLGEKAIIENTKQTRSGKMY